MQEAQIKDSDQRKPLLSCLGLIEKFLLMSQSVIDILVPASYDGGYNCWLIPNDTP